MFWYLLVWYQRTRRKWFWPCIFENTSASALIVILLMSRTAGGFAEAIVIRCDSQASNQVFPRFRLEQLTKQLF